MGGVEKTVFQTAAIRSIGNHHCFKEICQPRPILSCPCPRKKPHALAWRKAEPEADGGNDMVSGIQGPAKSRQSAGSLFNTGHSRMPR